MDRSLLAAIVAAGIAAPVVSAQRPAERPPAPPGQEIVARDGDLVILEDDARVQIMRRRQATVRAIFDNAGRQLIVLVDYAQQSNSSPDGFVDVAYRYDGLVGTWPLETRWEAFTTIEEYVPGTPPSSGGLGLVTPAGLVQILPQLGPPGAGARGIPNRSAIAVLTARGFASHGVGRIPPVSFDQAEQEQIAQAGPNGQMRIGGAGSGSVTGYSTGSVGDMSSWSASSGGTPPSNGAVRVGGGMRAPRKIRDAAAVYPEAARQANVRGIVILEVTVGADGSVTNPRVLRGIPLLDQAALDAVRQWHYEPVLMNGVGVPVIMTVMVPVGP